jgi:hypothetical protein
MKYSKVLYLSLLLTFCVSCAAPAGTVDNSNPMLFLLSIAIIITVGLIVVGLTVTNRKKRHLSHTPNTPATKVPVPNISDTAASAPDSKSTDTSVINASTAETIASNVPDFLPTASDLAILETPNQTKPEVHLQPEKKRRQAAIEVVNVPVGVAIKVKRSRKVEHIVEVEWRKSTEADIELGLKGIVSASILGEIEQAQGRSYQQSETMEYEINLNGEKNNRYKLIWVDTLLVGVIEIHQDHITHLLPFQFREGTELEVVPF